MRQGRCEIVTKTAADHHQSADRALRYRELAAQTAKLADAAPNEEIRSSYLSLSACWISLAHGAERFGDFTGEATPDAESADESGREFLS